MFLHIALIENISSSVPDLSADVVNIVNVFNSVKIVDVLSIIDILNGKRYLPEPLRSCSY